MFRAARKDANHKEIADTFKKCGWSVLDVSQLKNCCDIIVSKSKRTITVEIKDGSKPPSQRRLTEGEIKFRNNWQGEYALIKSSEDVLKLNG